jgi:hypothetical protein
MKKLRLLRLVGITSISSLKPNGPLPRASVQEVPVAVVLVGGNLAGFQSSTENQIQTTQAQSALPGKQNRNLRVGKPTTVSKTTGKPAPAGGKKRGAKVSPAPRAQ